MLTEPKAPIFHTVYNYEDGDIQLLSSDNVHFRIHSIVLKLASGVFRQMLEVLGTQKSEVIPLNESSHDFSELLDFVYPKVVEDDSGYHLPGLTNHKTLWDITCAADKYDMPHVLATIRSIVMNTESLKSEPLELYAVASRGKWAEIARLASTETLDTRIGGANNIDTLRRIEKEDLCKLLQLHASRKEKILSWFDWANRDESFFIVYEWDCSCSEEDDGTQGQPFQGIWEAMRLQVFESLERLPSGSELRNDSFWTSQEQLWSYKCRSCNRILIPRDYFIQRINEVFQDADLPNSI